MVARARTHAHVHGQGESTVVSERARASDETSVAAVSCTASASVVLLRCAVNGIVVRIMCRVLCVVCVLGICFIATATGLLRPCSARDHISSLIFVLLLLLLLDISIYAAARIRGSVIILRVRQVGKQNAVMVYLRCFSIFSV